ncbi:ubiquitin-associated domain-containing protein [Gottschalkia acidurici 9a]|uniref:Ubiquitin-associated domain-containing protein n=1 Tax=Gottschalkia acidurici (strain ATCC 7906 / DSM 604 / BCRC 14475 / CIP 104303 / KCTC 5404 / NCIMB 10678 / 9a) TaxID=1128398 RepID=K0B1I1_GOTA9|nr:DUF4342 domain-containing protein [Gottschalkia acidurici]AFS78815.1 ubiquitin-associated domain-containing protein [Gottschalkia acidurici 9a]
MSVDLEKIDAVRERTGASYKEAKEALIENDGSIVDAIIYLEEKGSSWGSNWTQNINSKGDELLEKLKEILKEGNVNKIVVKKDGEVIMNIPINVGVIGILAGPFLATVGLTAAVLTKCTIEINKKDGEVIKLGEAYEKAVSKVKSTINKNESSSSQKEEDQKEEDEDDFNKI